MNNGPPPDSPAACEPPELPAEEAAEEPAPLAGAGCAEELAEVVAGRPRRAAAPAARRPRPLLARLLPVLPLPFCLLLCALLLLFGTRGDIQVRTLTGMLVILEPRPGVEVAGRQNPGPVYHDTPFLAGNTWYSLLEPASGVLLTLPGLRVEVDNWQVAVRDERARRVERVEFSRARGVVVVRPDNSLEIRPQDALDAARATLALDALRPTAPAETAQPVPSPGSGEQVAGELPPLPPGEQRFIRIWTRDRERLVIILERPGAGRPRWTIKGPAQSEDRYGLPSLVLGGSSVVDVRWGGLRFRMGKLFCKLWDNTTSFEGLAPGRALVLYPDDRLVEEDAAPWSR